jgi:hypothetical protein
VRVYLDGPPSRGGAGIDVQVEGAREAGGARRPGELGLASIGGVRAGLELRKVPVECGFAGALAGGVVHHQRGVERDKAVTLDVRCDRGLDAGVVLRHAEVQQPTRIVEHGDARWLAFTPGEVQSDEVHRPTLPHRVAASPP